MWVSTTMPRALGLWILVLVGGPVGPAHASEQLQQRAALIHQAFLEDRREALPGLSDPYGVPAAARVVIESSRDRIRAATPWKRNVVATVFWIGEQPTENNPTPNDKSAWDVNWVANFGGTDSPNARDGWCPRGFTPLQTPFYVALPYNDVMKGGVHRPEASEVIPWFWDEYRGDGISVCKGRWVGIHLDGRVCYARWEDVGPFEIDHWQYVFGDQSPRANRNDNAGIDVSPAVRDFLRLKSGQRVQWRFVEERDVPAGPWRNWSKSVSINSSQR